MSKLQKYKYDKGLLVKPKFNILKILKDNIFAIFSKREYIYKTDCDFRLEYQDFNYDDMIREYIDIDDTLTCV